MTDQPSAAMNAVFASLRAFLIAVGGALLTAGFTVHSPLYFWIMFLSGSITVLGPAAWGFWVAIQHAIAVRQATAKGVQAGINLVVAGEALTMTGRKIPGGTGDGSPLPVTENSAAAIVQRFAPQTAPKAA